MNLVQAVRYQDSTLEGRALISDPPYGGRTHKGHNEAHKQIVDATGQATRRAITYDPWTAKDVRDLILWSADRVSGWRACMTSHDLIPAYMEAYEEIGLYAFAPVGIILPRPRLLGDGPASWLIYLLVARPKTREFMRWRCLPGAYRSSCERNSPVVGAKRIELMSEVIRDYSNPGDKIIDPCAGWASTGVAALLTGRSFEGTEQNADLAGKANERLTSALMGEIKLKPTPVKQAKERKELLEDEVAA